MRLERHHHCCRRHGVPVELWMAMVTGGRIGEVRPRFGDQTAHSDQSKPISLSWLVDGLLRRRGMALAVWPEGVQVAKESLLGSACKIVLRVGLRRNWRAIHSAGRWMIRRVGLVWLVGERPRVLSPAGAWRRRRSSRASWRSHAAPPATR